MACRSTVFLEMQQVCWQSNRTSPPPPSVCRVVGYKMNRTLCDAGQALVLLSVSIHTRKTTSDHIGSDMSQTVAKTLKMLSGKVWGGFFDQIAICHDSQVYPHDFTTWSVHTLFWTQDLENNLALASQLSNSLVQLEPKSSPSLRHFPQNYTDLRSNLHDISKSLLQQSCLFSHQAIR